MLKLALYLLNKAKLSPKDRNQLISACLDKLHATPLRDIITYNTQGAMLINGNEIDVEAARILRESAKGALNSRALNLIYESVKYQAFVVAAINAKSDEDLLFGKAAIWFCQEQHKLLKAFAGEEEISLSE